MSVEPVRVVLAGVHGHGRWHLDNLRRLADRGTVRLAGVCDTKPVDAAQLAGFGRPEQASKLAPLIRRTGAELVILATPIHTHAELGTEALRAGAHLLLEKPPAGSFADYTRLSEVVSSTGLACQVGFQSLGSAALPYLRELLAENGLGPVRGIGVAGAWARPAAYFERAPWAGKRRLNGIAVTDGALTNPFAHAIASALWLAGAEEPESLREIDVELYRVNPIEADDTSCVRLRVADGTVITVAVSMCADRRHEPAVVVHGQHGQAELTYTTDEVCLRRPGAPDQVTRHPRTDLLENLVEHIRDGTELLVPLQRTGAFMRVVDAVRRAAEPRPIAPVHLAGRNGGGRVLADIERLTRRSADNLAMFSELEVPWAPAEQVLRAGDREVAAYRWRPDPGLPATVAPRPHLHTVRTLGGVEVSETGPVDHPHHLGVGVALSDVDGTNFWGGRTYVRGQGPRWLDDHGSQRHLRFTRRESCGFTELLDWVDRDGQTVARERRTVIARRHQASRLPGCWELDFTFRLDAPGRVPLTIRSSHTKGRAGAGYGGFFWRAPASSIRRRVFTAEGDGEDAVNGAAADWVALSGTSPSGRAWTLIFTQSGPDRDRWFARERDYPGIGPGLAWERPLNTGSVTRRIRTVVADGRLDRRTVAALIRRTSER
ncbi:DUF6807 family protein [Amycolatopsis magusensis]|uniref:DUF6807 family protein n=1 Tax=Amycolatopsis magusensis TaxID=882444 RepID=UPI0024A7B691|nr:DUF6807 family protein [Amycolatopsis magusensis]MDI5977168.1 PmoA family protein [Amycolatopsis magusensis]